MDFTYCALGPLEVIKREALPNAAGVLAAFRGYGAVFNNRDEQGDMILPGAFAKSIGKAIPMMYDHFGGVVGKVTPVEEDAKGLVVEGELTEGVQQASEMLALIKHGAISGLSIRGGLNSKDWTYDEATNTRTIKRVDPLREVSLTPFPANPKARVQAGTIKSALAGITECETLKDVEALLRDAGWPPEAAKEFVAKTKAAYARDVQRDFGEQLQVAVAVSSLNESLRKMREGT